MKDELKDVKFSKTEFETLLLFCCNKSQKEVADLRCLNFETIQGHSKSIRSKMKCNNMATAVFRAYALGLFSAEDVERVMKKQ